MAREFSEKQALQTVLQRLFERSPPLHDAVLNAINAGREVALEEGRGRKKRVVVRTERLTDPQALKVALRVLHSYFVELPAVIKSAGLDILGTPVGARNMVGSVSVSSEPLSRISVEIQTEEQYEALPQPVYDLAVPTSQDLEELTGLFNSLSKLLELDGEGS